jgi:hypothetical protein
MSTSPAEVSVEAAPSGPGARFKAFKEKHHIAFELAFFFAGFLFDVVLLHRIDSTPLLIHQGVYLLLSAVLIFVDHRLHVAGKEPAGFLGKIASYRLWVMHFFLGTLLNAFMVFYFRASSGLLSFLFLVALAGLIVANELPRFRSQGPVVRVAMLSFATTSFLAYLLPVIVGKLGSWQYYLAVVVGSAVTFGLWKLFTRFTKDPNWTFQRAVAPGLVVQSVLFVFYLLGAIPPVPLSLKHIHVYSHVLAEKNGNERRYVLEYQVAPIWHFWNSHWTDFVASPTGVCLDRANGYAKTEVACDSDKACEGLAKGSLCSAKRAWVYVRVFAPTRFHDTVRFAWEMDGPKGWVDRGGYEGSLSGGSEEGYHTFAYSTISDDTDYRVRVLAKDGREIGRLTFRARIGEPPPTQIEID